jgi:hypothetical protein
MKAKRYETYGVHLGWAIPMMDGFLFQRPATLSGGSIIEWDWGYVTQPNGDTAVDPRGYLEAL